VALTVAALDAARRGHDRVRPEHLVFATLSQMEITEGKDLSHARGRLEGALAVLPSAGGAIESASVEISEALQAAIVSASRAAMMRMRPVTLEDVLFEARSASEIATLLDLVQEAPEPTPSRESARILGTPYRTPALEERARIVLWNDEVSTMEGVVDVLRECFAASETEALHLMLTTHYAGRATILRFAWPEAKARVEQALRRARLARMPLRITLERQGETAGVKKSGLRERVKRLFAKSA
jgi:ATP-dependent Clp protease adapter protein ClpS